MVTRQDIEMVTARAGQMKALVIGDAMLDQYIYGQVNRMSPEAPVPILTHQRTETKAGGAANVALNLEAWGCRTTLIGVVGTDTYGKMLQKLLEDNGIRHQLLESPSRPTTIKTRVVSSTHHVLRIDHESELDLDPVEEARAIDLITGVIGSEKPDLIILEDYNKGFLTLNVIESIIREGKKHHAFIAVDPKDKNFFAYRNVDLFKPNLREAGHAAQQHLSVNTLEGLCRTWRTDMGIDTIAITLGSQGIFLQNATGSQHIQPRRTIDVVDVCGAGDAVICALALGLMSGLSLEASGSLGNATGGYVCSHSGVVAIDLDHIHQWIS